MTILSSTSTCEVKSQLDYDLVIVGAGSTGYSLLLGLLEQISSTNLHKILLIDKEGVPGKIPGRSIALNQGTLEFLQDIKVELAGDSTVEPTAESTADSANSVLNSLTATQISAYDYLASDLEAIKTILTKSQTHSQVVEFIDNQHQLDQFGADIDLADLVTKLEQLTRLKIANLRTSNPNIQVDILHQFKVAEVKLESGAVGLAQRGGASAGSSQDLSYRTLTLVDEVSGEQYLVSASLVAITNGAKFISGLRLDSQPKIIRHNQVGIIADVEFNQPINNQAIEYFSAHGPIAFLPTSKTTSCVVYCTTPERALGLKAQPEVFVGELNRVLADINSKNLVKPERTHQHVKGIDSSAWLDVNNLSKATAGGFQSDFYVTKVSVLSSYPLNSQILSAVYEPNLVYLGNAAHTLHPVSGQGFNLAVLSIKNFIKALGETADQARKQENNRCDNFAMLADAVARKYNQIYYPLAREVFNRTNALAAEFTVEAKSPAFIRDFALYHLKAYPELQRLIINPSIGKVKAGQFNLIYRFLFTDF